MAVTIGDYERIKGFLKLTPDPLVDASCRYLEQRGQEFCVHFGTDNAVDKAFEELERDPTTAAVQ